MTVLLLYNTFGFHGRLFPENLFHPNRKYKTVYLDSQERNKPYSFNSEFRQFDFIFRTHYNSKFKYPSNFHPWFFGFPTEYFKSLKAYQIFKIKRHLKSTSDPPKLAILWNTICKEFTLIQNVLPIDDPIDSPLDAYHYLQWVQTDDTTWFTTNTWKSQLHALALGGFCTSLASRPERLITRVRKRVMSWV